MGAMLSSSAAEADTFPQIKLNHPIVTPFLTSLDLPQQVKLSDYDAISGFIRFTSAS